MPTNIAQTPPPLPDVAAPAETPKPARRAKPVADSLVRMTELVMPNDTNPLHNLMGGRMMHWMDVVAAISAGRHSNAVVVTASVDNVSFGESIKLGNVVTLEAQVTRAFRTSMEVHINVWAEDIPMGRKVKSNEAFLTFVALTADGKTLEVPEAIPSTAEDQRLYDGALRRRQLRLVLAGRMKAHDAVELKSIFFDPAFTQ